MQIQPDKIRSGSNRIYRLLVDIGQKHFDDHVHGFVILVGILVVGEVFPDEFFAHTQQTVSNGVVDIAVP